jgi:hypothetical protein
MNFYKNERGFSVDGQEVLLVHNLFTGSKRIYVNNKLTRFIPPYIYDCLNRYPILINGVNYELIVKPGLKYSYNIVSRQHGYGLLDEVLL